MVNPCACVAFRAPALTVVVLVPVVLFWAPAVVFFLPLLVLVPVALFWATTIATGVNTAILAMKSCYYIGHCPTV